MIIDERGQASNFRFAESVTQGRFKITSAISFKMFGSLAVSKQLRMHPSPDINPTSFQLTVVVRHLQ